MPLRMSAPDSATESRRPRRTKSRSRWSLARQLVALQIGLVVLILLGATVLAGVNTDSEVEDQAGRRCLVVALTIADTPAVLAALGSANPTTVLQPMAKRIQVDTGVDFVTIMSLDGIRYTHRDPAQIGKKFIGTTGPALAGQNLIETYAGTLGESIRAVVPIRDGPGGAVVALVSVGVTLDVVADETSSRIWVLVLGGLAVLAVALLGTYLIGRRVDRLTHRLGPAELGVMYEHYDAVLHSLREGLLLLDADGRVKLANSDAIRLLALESEVAGTQEMSIVGRLVSELGLPADLVTVLTSGDEVIDSVHLAAERVIVVSSRITRGPSGNRLGNVVTLRDHTEIRELASELGVAKDLAEALRSQAHESANRLHAVVGLIELDRPAEAVAFATEELRIAQLLTDQVADAIAEPVIAAVLLGKLQIAAERGIAFDITEDSVLDSAALEDAEISARDVVTVLGNLIDNALDAVSGNGGERRVTVTIRRVSPDSDSLHIRVADSGPGLTKAVAAQMFTRNFSTKRADDTVHGHGLGLAIVEQVVNRHRGVISFTTGQGNGTAFTVELGQDGRRG